MALSSKRQQAVYDALNGISKTSKANTGSKSSVSSKSNTTNKTSNTSSKKTDSSKTYYQMLNDSSVSKQRQYNVFKALRNNKIGHDISEYDNVKDGSELSKPSSMLQIADSIAEKKVSANKAKNNSLNTSKTTSNTNAKKNSITSGNKTISENMLKKGSSDNNTSLYDLTNTIANGNKLPGTRSAVTTAAKKNNTSKFGQTLNNTEMYKRATELANKKDWTEEERKEADEIRNNFNNMSPQNRNMVSSANKSTQLLKEEPKWKDVNEALKTGYHNVLWKDPESIYDTANTYSKEERDTAVANAESDRRNPLTRALTTEVNGDTDKKTINDIKKYTSMTDEQKRRYNEIYSLYGKKEAEEYHEILLNEINQNIANEELKNNPELQNKFGKTAYMFTEGATNAVKGVGELARGILGDNTRKATDVADYVASGIRNNEDNGTIENAVYDIAQSTGYMAPGMLLSGGLGAAGVTAKTAQTAGNVLFGLAQAGNTYRNDINEGKSFNASMLHSGQQAIDETATNWLLGGINAFGGGTLKTVLGNTKAGQALSNGITGLAKTKSGKVVLQRMADAIADMGGEAAQEYLQFYTENLTNNLLYGNTESLDPLDPDAWYAAALGALNAGILNLPNNIVRTTHGIRTDVSLAAETAASLDLDRTHYTSDEDFEKVETLKAVADEVAQKVANGTVGVADKIAYNEAVADVLASEANTEYNRSAISEDEEQVQVRLLPVNYDESAATLSDSISEATAQWEKILTNPKMNSVASTDGSTSYTVERNGDTLLFTEDVDGKTRTEQEYPIANIGKGGDTDILTVMPIQGTSETREIPQLTTFVNYAKGGSISADTNVNNVDNVDNYGLSQEAINNIRTYQEENASDIASDNGLATDTFVTKENFPEYSKQYSAELNTKESTDNMINLWNGKNASEYLSAYKRVYTAGFNNVDQATAERAITNSYLTPEQRQQAYKDGMRDGDAKRKASREQTYNKGEAREGGITKGEELVDEDKAKFLNWVGKKTGFKIEIAEGLKGEAEINVEKGVMRINPYAKNFVGSTAHELTHMIKLYAPEQYDTLEKLTVEALMKSKEVDYETLYNSYEEVYRKENPSYTSEDIVEEMVADGATAYMNDADFAERVVKADRKLGERLRDFFKEIADVLKRIINEKGIRKVGRVMRENETSFRMASNTWANALEKASERYGEGYTVKISDGEKYQIKEKVDINAYQMPFPSLEDQVVYPNKKDSTLVDTTISDNKKKINNQKQKSAEKEHTRFQSAKDPVEYTRDLIAVRNVSTNNLASMLELEGMPSPSIAITKADLGHTQFGDISFIFGRSTIDPEADNRNMVFTADAWTPTYDQLGIDTEIKAEKLNNIRDKFYAYGKQHTMFRDTLPDADNFSYKLDKYDGNLHEMADNSYDWKQLYLNDKGDQVEIKSETKIEPYSLYASNEEIEKLADTEIRDMVEQYMDLNSDKQKEYIRDNRDKIANIYQKIVERDLFVQKNKNLPINAIKNGRARDVLMGVLNYVYEKPTSYVSTDYDGAKKEIDSKIDTKDYHKWVDENLKGAIGRKGIRNDKDMFTNSGNRRSFSQLHDAYTAENIVRALWKNSEQGISALGTADASARTLRGATAEKFKNVKSMHQRSSLLQNDTISNVDEAIKEADAKLSNIYKQISDRRTNSWSIGWEETYNETMVEAATKADTSAKVKRLFNDENIRVTDTEASQLFDIFEELRNLPTDYFEAKAKRVVGFDEIKLAIVPDDIDTTLIDKLKEKGVARIETYPAGDNEARLAIENKAEDLRFQLGIDPGDANRQQLAEAETNEYSDNMVRNSNKELQEATETLGTLLSAVDYMPSDKAIERTAKRLKKYTETDTRVEDIIPQLKTIFNYIAYSDKLDGAMISDIAADYAGELISNNSKLKVDADELREFKRYKDAIKGYTFHMPEGFEGEVETLGGVGKLRKQFFGTLNITKNKGVSIDTMYQELADLYPDMFDKNKANPADQLEDIVDHLSNAPKADVSYKTDADYDAFRYYAGQEIFKAYIAEGAAEAGARSEYQKLKHEYNKQMKASEKSEVEMAALQSKATEMQARYLSELEASKKKVTRQTMNDRVKEARQSTKLRYHKDQIIKNTKELSRWLLKPTDKNHVPESLRTPLAAFLQQVDFSSKENLANGDPTQRTLLWQNLTNAWAKIANNGGVAEDGTGTQYIEVDPDIVAKMEELTAKVKDMKRMEDLDYIGVLQLSDILKSMKHAITNANELMSTSHYKTVAAAAESTLAELGRIDTRKDFANQILGGFQKLLGSDMLDASTRFHTFGTAAEDIYKGLRKSFNKKVRRTAEAADAFKNILKDAGVSSKDINKWSSGKSEDLIKITTTRGVDLKLTVAQVMSLYELMQRKQAKDHVLTGGITSANISIEDGVLSKHPGLKAKQRNKTGNVKVTQADVLNLIDQLTPEQIKVADGITAFFQTTAQWGNNAAMQMYGYKKFNDPHYFPIKVDSNYLTTTSDAAALNSNAVAIKNMGMTKSTVPHANNPLVLSDIFDVFTDQVNDMSNYEAFLVPLSDLQKWYNFKDSSQDEKFNTSIKKELERVYGTEAQSYINKFMQNINGMKDGERYRFKWLVSAFKGAAVGANLSVAIQQPTAYARAMAVIEPKYLMQALTTKSEAGSWDNIKERSSIAQWKEWGFYETDIGRTMKNILTDPDTLLDKAKELQMAPAGKGDEIAWKRLWVASELKVKAEQPELTAGSNEFFNAVSDVFDDVIDRTQVVDSVFHRTDIMRSTNDLTLMSTAFMAEPMKSYNMLYRAAFDYKNAQHAKTRKEAGEILARSGMAFIMSNALAAMAKSIISAMRDKDDERDEAFWKRWMKHSGEEFLGNIMFYNNIPLVKDIVSIFQGYDVSRTDLTAFQDLYYVINRWTKYFKGESKYSLGNNVLYSTKAISNVTGLALYGLQRDLNAIFDTICEALGADDVYYQKQKLLGSDISNKSNAGYYIGMAMKAYRNDNKGLGDKIIHDMVDAGIAQETIDTKMKSLAKKDVQADDSLSKLLDDAASTGKLDLSSYKEELKSKGYSDETIESTISSQISSYMDDNGLSYKALNEELNKISDYASAGYKDYNELYKKWSNLAKAKNGWDDDKCRQQFRSQCTQYFKPLYQDGNAKERSRILNILSRAKSDKGEKIYPDEKDIKKWGEK